LQNSAKHEGVAIMKKLLLVFLLLISLSAKDSSWSLKINPLPLVVGVLSADIEARVMDWATVSVTYQGGGIILADTGFDIQSYGIKATYYTNTIKDDGYYITPSYQNFSSNIMIMGKKVSTTNENAYGIIVGYHYDWFDFINLNTGLGYNYVQNQDFRAVPLFSGVIADFSFGFDF
jgi:hypothetical protein